MQKQKIKAHHYGEDVVESELAVKRHYKLCGVGQSKAKQGMPAFDNFDCEEQQQEQEQEMLDFDNFDCEQQQELKWI